MLSSMSPLFFARIRTKADRAEKGLCFLTCIIILCLSLSFNRSGSVFLRNDKLLFDYTRKSLSLGPLLFMANQRGKLIIISGLVLFII